MHVHMIVAMTPDRVIGKGNRLPWSQIPSDTQRFRRLTMGHPCIMGSQTFFGILNMLKWPLDGRTSIVLTSRHTRKVEDNGGIAVSSPEIALKVAQQFPQDPFVIGGSKVYEQFLPLTDRLHVTNVQAKLEGDAYFPDINLAKWGTLVEALTLGKHNLVDSHHTSYAVFARH